MYKYTNHCLHLDRHRHYLSRRHRFHHHRHRPHHRRHRRGGVQPLHQREKIPHSHRPPLRRPRHLHRCHSLGLQ